jgi:HK97 family phage major capsid protein
MTIEDIQDAIDAILAEADGRDLTDEESATIEAHEAELAQAQARRARTEAFRARQAERARIATPALHVKGRPSENADTLDKAFTAYMRTGRENADIQQLRAAQTEGVPSEGGFLVPDGFRTKIIERMVAFGGLAPQVDEITTETGNNLPWLIEGDDTNNRAEQVAEGGTMSGGADLEFDTASLGAYSYMAGGANGSPLRLPRELVQDSAFDIEGRVARKLGERGARKRAELIVNGTGVNQPQGIVTGRTGITLAANTGITYADLLGFVHSVDPAYREAGNCRWAFNDNTLETFEGMLDDNGRPLLTDANAGIGAAPGGKVLLGFPVTIDQAFADVSLTSSSVNWGVFGNLREGYVIRNVRAIELLVNPYSRMSNRQIEYSSWFRFDAMRQNDYAYSALTGHNG